MRPPQWKALHPATTVDMLGILPSFLDVDDPRPAAQQFNTNYVSGWGPFKGHTFDARTMTLKYPEDPPIHALAETQLRDERIILFECSWVMILQKDGSHEISRMD